MRLGIIGLPRSGKSTVFAALTCSDTILPQKEEDRLVTIQVPDPRLDKLCQIFNPRKIVRAQMEFFLPRPRMDAANEQAALRAVRDCDALMHVVRNHAELGFEEKSPYQDFRHIEQELILADLEQIEKRLERLQLDHQRGKKMDPEEHGLLTACRETLESETPLRKRPELANAFKLKGYALLTAKPMLILFNNADTDENLPDPWSSATEEESMVIRATLEHELAQMTAAEAEDFLQEFGISASARDRIIRRSFTLLGLISFFTAAQKEVHAWSIKKGAQALDAAELIHSDMKKGFIRAEVLAYDDLLKAGDYANARKQGTVKLVGKAYEIMDGDVVTIRFNI